MIPTWQGKLEAVNRRWTKNIMVKKDGGGGRRGEKQ